MKFVGYARVSDKEQVKSGFSIEAQQEAIEAWTDEHNHHLVKIFVEPGRSGSKPSQNTRPTFEGAVRYVLAGAADGLVVKWMAPPPSMWKIYLRVRGYRGV